jgi:DNA-binding NarL/FixJ family response regulator
VTLVVSPLPEETFWATTPSRSVAVFVSAPSRRPPWSESPIRSAFGLTFTEARVATLLAGGMPTPAIASELGVRTGTIRAHLKAIFGKTGTHSQAELLNMLFQTNAYNVGRT